VNTKDMHVLFRDEAVRHHLLARTHGEPLKMARRWSEVTLWLALGTFALVGLYLGVGFVPRCAEGPAVARLEGVADVLAPAAGTVTRVYATLGDEVSTGASVAIVSADAPENDGTGGAKHITVTAPSSGVVSDLPMWVGMPVTRGRRLAGIAHSRSVVVTAWIPARFRGLATPYSTVEFESNGIVTKGLHVRASALALARMPEIRPGDGSTPGQTDPMLQIEASSSGSGMPDVLGGTEGRVIVCAGRERLFEVLLRRFGGRRG
jgi:hypothetical protein